MPPAKPPVLLSIFVMIMVVGAALLLARRLPLGLLLLAIGVAGAVAVRSQPPK